MNLHIINTYYKGSPKPRRNIRSNSDTQCKIYLYLYTYNIDVNISPWFGRVLIIRWSPEFIPLH